MKITFLGVSGALTPDFNSNMLIEDVEDCMLFDCGEDVMHSLKAAGRTPEEITSVYISHLHYDHMGGLSWLAYYNYFVLNERKITLFIHESMLSELWAMLRPAMEKLGDCPHEMMTLDDYFDIVTFKEKEPVLVGSIHFIPFRQVHVETYKGNMYSYGAVFTKSKLVHGHWSPIAFDDTRIFITSDTKRFQCPSLEFNYLFCDCDVMNRGGVHVDYSILKKLPPKQKERMWLYHYTDLSKYDLGQMPDAVADGFAGFVKEGQVFEI